MSVLSIFLSVNPASLHHLVFLEHLELPGHLLNLGLLGHPGHLLPYEIRVPAVRLDRSSAIRPLTELVPDLVGEDPPADDRRLLWPLAAGATSLRGTHPSVCWA